MRSSSKHTTYVLLTLFVFFGVGCAASSGIQRESLENKTIAASAAVPPAPFVQNLLLASAGIYPYDPHGRPPAGPARAEHRTAERVEGTLLQASEQVDVSRRVAEHVLVGVAHDFGAAMSTDVDTADYILDVQLYRYGLIMRSSQQVPHFYVELEAVLKDRVTDTVVWRDRLERDRFYLSEQLIGEQWAQASENLMAQELRHLAEQIAVHLTEDLQREAR